MFCPNCGTNNPDNAVVCGNCGTPFNQGQPANVQPAYTAQPVYNQVGAPVSKKDYFKNMPSPKAKSLSLISLILAVVLVVSVAATYFVATNTAMCDIPMFKIAVDDIEEEYDDVLDEMEDALKAEKRYIKSLDLSDEDEELLDDYFSVCEDLADKLSISNLKAGIKAVESLDDLEDDSIKVGDISEVAGDAEEIFGIFSTVILCTMLFVLLFAALGGFLKIRGLVITSLIFSILYTLILCGVLWCIILAVVHIALIVVLTKRNAEYKEYKKSFGM